MDFRTKESREIAKIEGIEKALAIGKVAYALRESQGCRAFFCEAFFWPEHPTALEQAIRKRYPAKSVFKNNFPKYAKRLNKAAGFGLVESVQSEENGRFRQWVVHKGKLFENPFETVNAVLCPPFFEPKNVKSLGHLKEKLFEAFSDIDNGFAFLSSFLFVSEDSWSEVEKEYRDAALKLVDAGLKGSNGKLAVFRELFVKRTDVELGFWEEHEKHCLSR